MLGIKEMHCGWAPNLIINPKPKVQTTVAYQSKLTSCQSVRDFDRFPSCASNKQVFGTQQGNF